MLTDEILLGEDDHSLPGFATNLREILYFEISGKTRKNLELLTKFYGIIWSKYFKYDIAFDLDLNPNRKIRSGVIVYGNFKNNNSNITYMRRQTPTEFGSKTLVYFLNSKYLPVMLLLGEKKAKSTYNQTYLNNWIEFCLKDNNKIDEEIIKKFFSLY